MPRSLPRKYKKSDGPDSEAHYHAKEDRKKARAGNTRARNTENKKRDKRGRPRLRKNQVVHHVNGDQTDNSKANTKVIPAVLNASIGDPTQDRTMSKEVEDQLSANLARRYKNK